MGVGASCASRVADTARAQPERLIPHATVLVAGERVGSTLDAVVAGEDEVAIAAITAAELLVGVELASRDRRGRRREFVDRILGSVPVETYDLAVARAHASLLAHTRRAGMARGTH